MSSAGGQRAVTWWCGPGRADKPAIPARPGGSSTLTYQLPCAGAWWRVQAE